jgi:phytanoyl-CoA hydroxylase
MLSEAQVGQFQRDGFLLGEKLLDERRIELLRSEVERVIADRDKPVPQPVLLRVMDGEQVWQIVNIWQVSEPFRELIFDPRITTAIAQMTGARELRVWQDQIVYKPVTTGGINHWHQDSPVWPMITLMDLASAWIALDDADESNGCMSMVPGSHRWGNAMDFLNDVRPISAMPNSYKNHPVTVSLRPVPRGHVHFHHSMMWHGSHANTSGRPRRGVALHYITERTRFVECGDNVMKRLITVKDGEQLVGDAFPVVWSR